MTEHESPELSAARRGRLIRLASYASLSVAFSLVALKTWGWYSTSSVSLLSSLADSVLDVFASAITFWAVRFSLSPADKDHRFGHGKSEGVAALLQAGIVTGSGVYVCYEAFNRLVAPQPIHAPEVGLAVTGIAIIATFFLVGFQKVVGRKTQSVAIKADALHYQSDLLVNVSVGISLILTPMTGWLMLDPIVGFIIALFIIRSAYGIGRHSLEILLDHEIPEHDRERIKEIALRHPDVRGFHDMRTRFGGNHFIVQFHLEMEPEISLLRTHEILDDVEDQIRRGYPGCEIIIHPDPLGLLERRDPFEQV